MTGALGGEKSVTTATMRAERPTLLAEELEAVISAPGTAFDGQILVNFQGPPAVDFLLRMEPRLSGDTECLPFFEVHQPHVRGVEWATLELPIGPVECPVEIEFQARCIPRTAMDVKLYGESLEYDVSCLSLNHVVNRYRVLIDGDGIAAIGGKSFRLGFCLPGGTWFVFQLSGFTILPVKGGSVA